jgi:hypothetical protein
MAHERLKNCPAFPEIDDKVKAGVTLEKVAADLQEQGYFTDVQESSVVRMLYRYKESLAATQLVKYAMPPHMHKKLQKTENQLDELDELQKLARLQIQRIDASYEQEKNLHFPIKSLDGMIQTAQGLVLASAKLKMDLGIYDKAAEKVELQAQVTQNHRLDEMEPTERKSLGRAAQAILASLLGPEEVLDATVIEED